MQSKREFNGVGNRRAKAGFPGSLMYFFCPTVLLAVLFDVAVSETDTCTITTYNHHGGAGLFGGCLIIGELKL